MDSIIPSHHTVFLCDDEMPLSKHFVVHAYAHLTYIFFIKTTTDISITVELQGTSADARIIGVCVLAGQQRANVVTQQHHAIPHASSKVIIKGILADQSALDYQGIIKIDAQAIGSKASQQNKNILLSSQAQVRSQPALEVLNNNVICTHGSATGQLDSEQLFYMQSRGMAEKQAKRLLLEGFFADILNSIDDISYKKKIDESLKKRLSYLSE